MTLNTRVWRTVFQNWALANISRKTSSPTNFGSARLPGRPDRVESATAEAIGCGRWCVIAGVGPVAAGRPAWRVAARYRVRRSSVCLPGDGAGGGHGVAPPARDGYWNFFQASSSWLDADFRAVAASVPLMMSSNVVVMTSSNST